MSEALVIDRIDLDPVGGLAGDMFAAALIDAFPEREESLQRDLASAALPAGVTARTESAASNGFQGRRFIVTQQTGERPPRSLAEVDGFLDAGSLAASVRARAKAIFRLLAEAEGQVHGVALDQVHFHEVSDWDSLVDIVAAASLADGLRNARWRVGALPLGSGTVRSAHGEIPLPAPAAAQLLRGFDWVDDGGPGERVTPTGAAILRHLDPGPLGTSARGALSRIGTGCGTRQMKNRPNILRAIAFTEAKGLEGEDAVERLAFEVDDMTGEEIAVALDHLRATAGVIDVAMIPMLGKKGRSVAGLRLLVELEAAESALEACFSETTTLGVRRGMVRRRVLRRRELAIDGARAKAAIRPGGVTTVKAESDDIAATPSLAARRALASRAVTPEIGGDGDD